MRLETLGTMTVGLLVGVVYPACSTDEERHGLSQGCTLNSDCIAGLVCSSNRCHVPCKESRDCTDGANCVKTEAGSVCQLPEERSDASGGGGATGSGGRRGTGGAAASGGTKATGGTSATGGSLATGGASETGGAAATGGVAATGGAPTTGGAPATGGRVGTGGTMDASADAPATVTLTIEDHLNWCTITEGSGAPFSTGKTFEVPKGTVVHLSATPTAGLTWGYWTGTDATDGGRDTNQQTTVTMDANTTVVACCPPSASVSCN